MILNVCILQNYNKAIYSDSKKWTLKPTEYLYFLVRKIAINIYGCVLAYKLD